MNKVINGNQEPPEIKGPLFYVKGEESVLCVHMYPSKLICNNKREAKKNE
jgi:hypothetical protein